MSKRCYRNLPRKQLPGSLHILLPRAEAEHADFERCFPGASGTSLQTGHVLSDDYHSSLGPRLSHALCNSDTWETQFCFE